MASRDQHNDSHEARRIDNAGSVAAPNTAAVALEGAREAIAFVTALHGSPDDLPFLLEDLEDEPLRQAVVAQSLLTTFVADGVATIAELTNRRPADVLEEVAATVAVTPEASNAWRRVLDVSATYVATQAAGTSSDAVAQMIARSVGVGRFSARYILTLTQLAHAILLATCDVLKEDANDLLRSLALPVASDAGNGIDADAVNAYIEALMAGRIDEEPDLLLRAAALLERPVGIPMERAEEAFGLGGAVRLRQLSGLSWDDFTEAEQRLVRLVVLDAANVDSHGETIAERVRVAWRI